MDKIFAWIGSIIMAFFGFLFTLSLEYEEKGNIEDAREAEAMVEEYVLNIEDDIEIISYKESLNVPHGMAYDNNIYVEAKTVDDEIFHIDYDLNIREFTIYHPDSSFYYDEYIINQLLFEEAPVPKILNKNTNFNYEIRMDKDKFENKDMMYEALKQNKTLKQYIIDNYKEFAQQYSIEFNIYNIPLEDESLLKDIIQVSIEYRKQLKEIYNTSIYIKYNSSAVSFYDDDNSYTSRYENGEFEEDELEDIQVILESEKEEMQQMNDVEYIQNKLLYYGNND